MLPSIAFFGTRIVTVFIMIDLNDVVKDVLRMVKAEALIHACVIKTSLDQNLQLVEGNPIEFQQVLVNLIVNSLEAMRDTPAEKRKIVIQTGQLSSREIEVSVSDRGVGLPNEIQARIFEQFFTTKAQGLGMGLAITRSIVEAHNGRIGAENRSNGGARFYFTLPVLATDKTRASSGSSAPTGRVEQ